MGLYSFPGTEVMMQHLKFVLIAGFFCWAVWGIPFRTLAASPQATPAVTSSVTDSTDEDQPFKPYWDNEIQFSSANQQAGQSTNSLSYTGTQHFNEAGDFLSGEVETSRQKIEGTFSTTGTLTVEGGLGIGFFSPALSLGFQGGESALKQINANLVMDFQVIDPLTISLAIGGNAGNHQGDVTSYLRGIFAANPVILAEINNQAPITGQIDTAGIDTSLGAILSLQDGWSVSLNLGYAYDQTYQIQSIKNASLKASVNDADQTATLTLGTDFTLFKGFVLDLEPQVGKEYQPAGTVFSHQTGGLVQNSSPTTNNFVGGAISVSYSF